MESPNWFEIRSTTNNPERRAYHTTFVTDNKLYVYGGEDLNEGTRANMYFMDLNFLGQTATKIGSPIADPSWQPVALQPNNKQHPGPLAHHSTVVYNGHAFVLGGNRPNG
jgi:hypothetical protein